MMHTGPDHQKNFQKHQIDIKHSNNYCPHIVANMDSHSLQLWWLLRLWRLWQLWQLWWLWWIWQLWLISQPRPSIYLQKWILILWRLWPRFSAKPVLNFPLLKSPVLKPPILKRGVAKRVRSKVLESAHIPNFKSISMIGCVWELAHHVFEPWPVYH